MEDISSLTQSCAEIGSSQEFSLSTGLILLLLDDFTWEAVQQMDLWNPQIIAQIYGCELKQNLRRVAFDSSPLQAF